MSSAVRRAIVVALISAGLLWGSQPASAVLGGGSGDTILCGGLERTAGVCLDDPVPMLPPVSLPASLRGALPTG